MNADPGPRDATAPGAEPDAREGGAIVAVDVAATAAFVVTAFVSAAVFEQPWKAVAVAVALACFTVGVVAFLWGYATAVQRSRVDDISVAALYFLVDGAAPTPVARRLNVLLGVQVVVGLATAIWRGSTDGEPGSTLAFGILVPMLGLGLNGLWGARHGRFRPRRPAAGEAGGDAGVPSAGSGNGQDEGHD